MGFSGGSLLGHFAGPASDGQHIIISGPTLSGRYVIVQMDNGMGAFLNLREVKAFGEEGCTIEQATDYFGWDLEGGSKIKVTANIQECADYSASTPGSRFWTWSKTTKKCYPKSSKAGRQEAGIEVVSGNNRCANSGCTIEQATDYYGWDLEGGSKIKVTANQQECADYS